MLDKHVSLDEIISGCREQNRLSQQRLYSHFYNYAMTVARRYMGGQELAEEVVNDAFFKVFTKIHLYSSDQSFKPWLRRVVVNTAIDRLRSQMSTPPNQELLDMHDSGKLSGIEENLTQEQIWSMLDKLPPAYRTVFNLAVIEGMTHEEIAQSLDISVGASKSNLSRARQFIRNMLKTEFEFFD
ncbi:MAG: RNA polymerase sigma factor [Chitinophagales bacterium]|nr:RNA polymerase sigma factor [Chitinophagales bacterium]